jgi:hypothetical protein
MISMEIFSRKDHLGPLRIASNLSHSPLDKISRASAFISILRVFKVLFAMDMAESSLHNPEKIPRGELRSPVHKEMYRVVPKVWNPISARPLRLAVARP